MRENPWLQLQATRCVLLNVRYALPATKFRSARNDATGPEADVPRMQKATLCRATLSRHAECPKKFNLLYHSVNHHTRVPVVHSYRSRGGLTLQAARHYEHARV